MCEPTLIMGTISALGTAFATDRQAKKQENLNNRSTERQLEEQGTVEAEQLSERARRAQQERSKLIVAAGEAGVGGVSLTDQINNSYYQEGRDTANIKVNSSFGKRAALDRNRSQNASIKQADWLGAGLVVGAAANKYNEKGKGKG